MKQCPYCSAELQENATFCPYCMKSLDSKTIIPLKRKATWLQPFLLGVLVLFFIGTLGLLLPGEQPQTSAISASQTTPPATAGQEDVPPPSSSVQEAASVSEPTEAPIQSPTQSSHVPLPPAVISPSVTNPSVTEPPATTPTEPTETVPPATKPTDPPVTQPPETQPPITQPPITHPPETQPPETQPPETKPPVSGEIETGPIYKNMHPIFVINALDEDQADAKVEDYIAQHPDDPNPPLAVVSCRIESVKVAQSTYHIPGSIEYNGKIYCIIAITNDAFLDTGATSVWIGWNSNPLCSMHIFVGGFAGCHLTDLYIHPSVDYLTLDMGYIDSCDTSIDNLHCDRTTYYTWWDEQTWWSVLQDIPDTNWVEIA